MSGCYYCRNGSAFRVNQNCPRCGRQGKLAADHDRRARLKREREERAAAKKAVRS